MRLIDWAARWDAAVEAPRPCQVWIPAQRVAAPEPAGTSGRRTSGRRTHRLRLTPLEAADLRSRVPAVLSRASCAPGDLITVDLSQQQPDLPGLGLLLATLWRSVGPAGDVRLSGVCPAVERTLARLRLTPDDVRTDVLGWPAASPARQQDPALVAVPSQRTADSALREPVAAQV